MNISIDGHHVVVTEPLKDYVNKKFERIENQVDHLTSAHVVLSVEKLEQKAEIQIHLKGKEIHASAKDNDMYAAIDAMMDKARRQAIKHKEKLHNHEGKDKDDAIESE